MSCRSLIISQCVPWNKKFENCNLNAIKEPAVKSFKVFFKFHKIKENNVFMINVIKKKCGITFLNIIKISVSLSTKYLVFSPKVHLYFTDDYFSKS